MKTNFVFRFDCFFRITSLQDREPFLIDSFSLFPCLCVSCCFKAWYETKIEIESRLFCNDICDDDCIVFKHVFFQIISYELWLYKMYPPSPRKISPEPPVFLNFEKNYAFFFNCFTFSNDSCLCILNFLSKSRQNVTDSTSLVFCFLC